MSLCLPLCLSGSVSEWVSGAGSDCVSVSSATSPHIVLWHLTATKRERGGAKHVGLYSACETQPRGCKLHKGRERKDREIHQKTTTKDTWRNLLRSPSGRGKISRGMLIPRKRSLPPIGDNIQAREMATPEKWPRDRGSEIIRREIIRW